MLLLFGLTRCARSVRTIPPEQSHSAEQATPGKPNPPFFPSFFSLSFPPPSSFLLLLLPLFPLSFSPLFLFPSFPPLISSILLLLPFPLAFPPSFLPLCPSPFLLLLLPLSPPLIFSILLLPSFSPLSFSPFTFFFSRSFLFWADSLPLVRTERAKRVSPDERRKEVPPAVTEAPSPGGRKS